jgi:hypothetical protein
MLRRLQEVRDVGTCRAVEGTLAVALTLVLAVGFGGGKGCSSASQKAVAVSNGDIVHSFNQQSHSHNPQNRSGFRPSHRSHAPPRRRKV